MFCLVVSRGDGDYPAFGGYAAHAGFARRHCVRPLPPETDRFSLPPAIHLVSESLPQSPADAAAPPSPFVIVAQRVLLQSAGLHLHPSHLDRLSRGYSVNAKRRSHLLSPCPRLYRRPIHTSPRRILLPPKLTRRLRLGQLGHVLWGVTNRGPTSRLRSGRSSNTPPSNNN